jgi:hypothetical protein
MSFSDNKIDSLFHEKNPFNKECKYTLPNAHLSVIMKPSNIKQAIYISEKALLNIIDKNAWNRPIFATSDTIGIIGPNLVGWNSLYQLLQPVESGTSRSKM